jgi:hypothetical protein
MGGCIGTRTYPQGAGGVDGNPHGIVPESEVGYVSGILIVVRGTRRMGMAC